VAKARRGCGFAPEERPVAGAAKRRARFRWADVGLGRLGQASAFLSLDYLHERQKTTQYEAGRRSNGADATVGADYRFGSHGLAGLALKYGNQWGDIDGGGYFDVKTDGIWAYGSWWPHERLFVDFASGFDLRQVHTERIVLRETTITFPRGSSTFFNPPPALAISDTNSREASAELRAGYDFPIPASASDREPHLR